MVCPIKERTTVYELVTTLELGCTSAFMPTQKVYARP
jgi:hypothetical protein